MKPVYINFLINKVGYKKVIYLDSDLFFFDDPAFLFDLLNENRVILTPHWLSAEEPEIDIKSFKANFTDGIYNAGFVGVRNDATEVMNFWAKMCYTICEINRPSGLYVDQKYLDILHSRFEGIGVVRHKGCNVSRWNIIDCKRTICNDGSVWIDFTFLFISI
jgi:lipopolysaccharide biosynthesis glycosyltransferase